MNTVTTTHTDTISGHPVLIGTYYVERPGLMPTRAVLVAQGDGDYVTALQVAPLGVPAGEWLHGHYFSDLSKAIEDFADRAAKLIG